MRARRKMQSTLCGSYHGVSKCTFCIRLKQSRQKNCQPVCVQAFCWWWWKPSISCSVTLQIKINTSCHQYRDHFIRKGKKRGGSSLANCHVTWPRQLCDSGLIQQDGKEKVSSIKHVGQLEEVWICHLKCHGYFVILVVDGSRAGSKHILYDNFSIYCNHCLPGALQAEKCKCIIYNNISFSARNCCL